MQEKVTLKWSKRERDWIIHYPNKAGATVGSAFFDMIRKFDEFMSRDWEGKPTGYTDFREYLSNAGYNPDTFQIIVKKQK